MEEYIRLEEEKAQKHGKVFNWETAKYDKIWYDKDVHDLRSVETEFPTIVFNNNLTLNDTLFCEQTVSSLNNNEIDFRISFDKSDDEDYTVVFDKNSFSYKIIYANDLKMDSENDNEKVNMPLFPSLEPKVDFSTEPTLCPQHIDEFDLKGETSLSEYDEVEQNVFYFNDLFPFNIIYPADLKLDKDNDDNEIDMIQSSRGNENTQGSNKLLEASHNKINKNLYVSFGIPFDPKWYYKDGDCTRMLRRPRYGTLPPHDQRHLWLHYQVEGYTEEIVHDFEQRLETIFGRQEFILEFFSTCMIGSEMGIDVADTLCFQLGGARHRIERVIPDKGNLSDYWVKISSGREFLRGAPSYTYIRDPVRRLCHRMISYNIFGRGQAPKKATVTDLFYLRRIDRRAANVPYLLAQYLFRHAEGRKSGARLFGGYYIRRLAHHFGLVSDDGLRGLSVMTRELPLIDIGELVKLNFVL
ncbi:hypothetical protein Tco_0703213 [Tanacetum coccineum]|uniref:Uncharacterized protein n=1 Tax=Tanacetum coccineum TaxID=301880 RepID=A0ABQ4XZI4_9ASTR